MSEAGKSDSTLVLGLDSELAQPAKGRHLSPTEVRVADPGPLDEFAGGHVGPCVDGAGYKRKRHLYVVWTRAGTRCCFCWRVRPYDPIG